MQVLHVRQATLHTESASPVKVIVITTLDKKKSVTSPLKLKALQLPNLNNHA